MITPRDDFALMDGYHSPQVDVAVRLNTNESPDSPPEEWTNAIAEAQGTELPGTDPSDKVVFLIDDDVCTRCALCVDRCPTGVIILGKAGAPQVTGDSHTRTNNHGYAYGMRF